MAQAPNVRDLTESLTVPLLELGDLTITGLFVVKAAFLVVVLVVLSFLVRRRLVARLLRSSNVDDGVKYAVARIAGYGVWVIGMLIGLPLVGIKLNSLLVAFGAVGIGIGLGLQRVAENFIGGLLILFGRPIKVGDRIRVGQTEGTVQEIQSRVTLVRDNNNVVYLVPNASIISELVVNLTHNDKVVRYRIDVGVSYEADPNTLRDCLLEVAGCETSVLDDPAPDVLFTGFGESSIDFTLRVYSRELVHRPEELRSRLYFAIWYRLEQSGIEIPYPQRDLHLKSVAEDGLKVVAGRVPDLGGPSDPPR